ncbi:MULTISPECIES: AbrB/MazE/SpoVT family DNA-binding domain-containing protein [unclassified Cryobacterium]|uniref:AbrB/MazE/SpoVT family DNA-binding domain-containing protein n=1 Tax=unclassified Cryobacterium TaxID=2649013 RepID=UPI00141AA284|nr:MULTISPECIES: AbrB/MazE/SpoVT family DNA-binding domain-containing protein [unclassified Cryobacterium]
MPNASGLHGPRTLTRSRQVCIPVTLLRQLGLGEGDDVYFELSPDGKAILIRAAADVFGPSGARR